MRNYNILDRTLTVLDQLLKNKFMNKDDYTRKYPAEYTAESNLSSKQKQHIAGLMRINHAGEVCAQALYQGQALTAYSDDTKQAMQQAADEEIDHLHWCKRRLDELHANPSFLDPLWYIGALGIGVAAGVCGDKISLGFLAETERQVVQHLEDHIKKLPQQDKKTRKILQQMQIDEAKHATMAVTEGAADLPYPVKQLMRCKANVMKTVAYYF